MTSRHIPFRLIDDRPRGPIVNVAFTIDGECVDLLHRAGKNRSRTVRNAIKSYLRGDYSRENQIKDHAELLERFQKVCIERDELREQLSTLQFFPEKKASLQATQLPGNWIFRILKRLRDLFNKHRE